MRFVCLLSLALFVAVLSGCNSTASREEPSVTSKPSSNPSCSLTPEQLAVRRQQLIPGLFRRAEQVDDIPNGISFRFAAEPGLLSDLARVIEQEQDCCSFLRFKLTTEPSAGPITFDVTGPPGTAEMLRKL